MMYKKRFAVNVVVTALTLLFVVIKGTKLVPFAGLPLNHYESLAIIIWLILVWTTAWHKKRWPVTVVLAGLCLLIVLKPIGASYIPSGWSVCLQREIALDELFTPCEPSAQFRSGNPSFILSSINFRDRAFPLYFMNNARSFNFIQRGQVEQRHLPYNLTAKTSFRPSKDMTLVLNTSIATQVSINDITQTAPVNSSVTIILPADTTTNIKLFYSTTRQDNQYFSVATRAPPFYAEKIPSYPFLLLYSLIFKALLIVSVLPIIRSTLVQFLMLRHQTQIMIALVLLMLSLWWQIDFAHYLIFSLIVLFLSWHLLTRQRQQGRLLRPIILILLLLATHRFVSVDTPYPDMAMGSVGRDTYSHHSMARNVYIAQDRGDFIGENLFYFQPLPRYLLAIVFKVMDESLWSVYLVQTYLAVLAVCLTLRLMLKNSTKMTGALFSVGFLGINGFGFVQYPWLSPFNITNTTYQHGMATPLILLASLLLIEAILKPNPKKSYNLALGLIIGLSLFTRMDYLPILATVSIYGLVLLWKHKPRKKTIVSLVLLGAGISVWPALIVTKNYLATGAPVLSPTSTTMNAYSGFRHIVPYASDPIPATRMVTNILSWYHSEGRYYDLMMALTGNLKDNFVGSVFQRQLLWYISPALAFFAFFQAKRRERLILFFLLIIFTSVVGLNLFFRLHPASFDMHIIFDYWLLVLAAFGASILWRQRLILKRDQASAD